MQGQRQEVHRVPRRWPLKLCVTAALLLRCAPIWNLIIQYLSEILSVMLIEIQQPL
jgi:hypothetical protein